VVVTLERTKAKASLVLLNVEASSQGERYGGRILLFPLLYPRIKEIHIIQANARASRCCARCAYAGEYEMVPRGPKELSATTG
jgi:hypothetical protein